MSLQEVTWFHPTLMDAELRQDAERVHAFMGLPAGTALDVHAIAPNGLVIEGSKHWEYAHALRKSGLLSRVGARILDAGCGRSAFTAYLAGRRHRVYGIDMSRVAVEQLRPHGVRVAVANLHALPYRSATFDQVFCVSVLEHTQDPLRCFDELWRVTRVGGTLSVTADYSPWGLPTRTLAAGRVMDRALVRRLAGPDAVLPEETPGMLEGLGYFPEMWPTVLPIYLRFLKSAPIPPSHRGAGGPASERGLAPLRDRRLRRHVALQCYRAARIYLSYDWIPEARALFGRAWRLDPRLVSAIGWGCASHLPMPFLRAARRARRAGATAAGGRA